MNEALSILREKKKKTVKWDKKKKKKIVARRLQTAQGEIKHGIFWRSLVQCAARRSFYHLKKQCLPLTKSKIHIFLSRTKNTFISAVSKRFSGLSGHVTHL